MSNQQTIMNEWAHNPSMTDDDNTERVCLLIRLEESPDPPTYYNCVCGGRPEAGPLLPRHLSAPLELSGSRLLVWHIRHRAGCPRTTDSGRREYYRRVVQQCPGLTACFEPFS